MSRSYSAADNEHQRHSVMHYRAYFSNLNEPRERMPADLPAELEAELIENSGPMRQEFRRLARRIRNRKA